MTQFDGKQMTGRKFTFNKLTFIKAIQTSIGCIVLVNNNFNIFTDIDYFDNTNDRIVWNFRLLLQSIFIWNV